MMDLPARQLAVSGLLAKYEELRRLRLGTSSGLDGLPGPAMASLAARFPGALRELDRLPLEVLEERIGALRGVVAGTEPEAPWMLPTARYHELARGALTAKRWLEGRRVVDDGLLQLFEAAHAADPVTLGWRGALAELARPPGGRIMNLVIGKLAAEFSTSPTAMRRLVFGALVGRRDL